MSTIYMSRGRHALQFLAVFCAVFQVSSKNCSDSTKTLEKVETCPKTAEEWDEASRRKNCSAIFQSCVPKATFVYHCVRNGFQNATLEVCAPTWTSAGYCVEFNEAAGIIQDNYNQPCTELPMPCPIPYTSTDVYKYQQCYQLSQSETTYLIPNQSDTTIVPNQRKRKFLMEPLIIVVVAGVIIIISFVIFLAYIKYNKGGRSWTLANLFNSGEGRLETVIASNSDIRLQRMWTIHTADIGIDEGRQVNYANAPNFPSDIRHQRMWNIHTADVGIDEAYRHVQLEQPRDNYPTDIYDTQRSQSTTYGGSSSTCSSGSSGLSERSLISHRRYPILQNIYESG